METKIKEIKEKLHELGYALSCKRMSLTLKTKRIHDLKQLIHSHRSLAYSEPFNDMECRLHLCQMHVYEDELKQERSCLGRYQYEQKQRKEEFKRLNTELNKVRSAYERECFLDKMNNICDNIIEKLDNKKENYSI